MADFDAPQAAPSGDYYTDVKLFGRWTYDDVEVKDISLDDYIAVKPKHATYLPHTAGRYAAKRFRKGQVSDFFKTVKAEPLTLAPSVMIDIYAIPNTSCGRKYYLHVSLRHSLPPATIAFKWIMMG